MSKTLVFHRQSLSLQDSDGKSFSLVDLIFPEDSLKEINFWQNQPWQESVFTEIDLGDMPCRLSSPSLRRALQKIWLISADEAQINMRLPHPHHDIFLSDLGYVRGLLPETLAQLDPRSSITGLATQLGVRFEMLETKFTLDPHWQKGIDEGKLSFEDIELIAKQALNVIEWMEIRLLVKKSPWVQTNAIALTEDMKKQLQEQIEAHLARGDEQAAAVIRQFLDKQQDKQHKVRT